MSTITTTLGRLVNAEPALHRLGEVKLPVKAAYHLAKLTKLVQAETRLFYEQRDAHIKELGVERDPTPVEARVNGGQKVTEVTPENRAEFFRRDEELRKVPVTIAWGPLNLEEIAGVEVPAGDLMELGPLVGLEDALPA